MYLHQLVIDMAKGKLEFELPEERYEFDAASRAQDFVSALNEIERMIRDRLKYGENVSENEERFLNMLREEIWEARLPE